jgi:hypothetical protein
MMKKHTVIILLIVVAGLSFYFGTKIGSPNQQLPGQNRQFTQGSFTGKSLPSGMIGRGNGVGTTGEILSQDATSITLKMRDGGSKIVFTSGTTEITKSVKGTLKDLTTGETIMVTGTTNPDGSMTAQTIQVRPPMPAVSPATKAQAPSMPTTQPVTQASPQASSPATTSL